MAGPLRKSSQVECRNKPMPNTHRPFPPWLFLAVVVVLCCFIYFRNLGSSHITTWDEVIHANVVKNLATDCCVPRLHRFPNLPIDYSDWTNNAVWLHKPMLPFFISAASYALLGHSLWAFRLPGAIFALLTTLQIFLIGRKFFDQNIAVIGSAVFGLNPYTSDQVHGIEFAGFPDLALVLCLTVALYFLLDWSVTHSASSIRWFGAAIGLAYLCKAGLALPPVVVLAILLFISPRKSQWTAALQAFATFLVIALPINLFWRHYYPAEFQSVKHEQLSHIFTAVSGWGRPWYAYFYSYLPSILTLPLVPFGYVSIAWAFTQFRSHRTTSILALWTLASVVPLSFAVSKVENFMFPVLPALALLAPLLVFSLLRERRFRLLLVICGVSVLPTLLHVYERSRNRHLVALIAFAAVLPLAFAFVYSIRKNIGNTAIAVVICSATVLLVTYVRTEARSSQIGDSPGEAALRTTGIELSHLADSRALVLAHINFAELGETYIMYWSGIDVLDPCRVPNPAAALHHLQNRTDLYLISHSPLPEPPTASLPVGNFYSLSHIPAERWQAALLAECH
jgi:4-amino-4-deoxy-L-arabinose transferase-like glycosyltransferase